MIVKGRLGYTVVQDYVHFLKFILSTCVMLQRLDFRIHVSTHSYSNVYIELIMHVDLEM